MVTVTQSQNDDFTVTLFSVTQNYRMTPSHKTYMCQNYDIILCIPCSHYNIVTSYKLFPNQSQQNMLTDLKYLEAFMTNT